MNNPLLAIQSQYWAVRDYLSPVLRESKFKEHGRITPEEFVAAGDFLTFKFPVWQWEKAEGGRAREFLPPDKQFLITRNVPCLRRATAVKYTDEDEDAEKMLSFLDEAEVAPEGADDEWVATHIGRPSQPTEINDIPDISDSPTLPATTSGFANLSVSDDKAGEASGAGPSGTLADQEDIPDIDDIPDMDDEGAGLEDDDNAVVKAPSAAEVNSTVEQNLLQVRTYDCYISYDKHYQTPRFWIFGYDENKKPLTSVEMFQDVPAEHVFKTLTMEVFPHTGAQLASIHPCKHASVMKKFIDRMETAQSLPEPAGGAGDVGGSGKKKWGLGGMMRRVTGGEKVDKEKDARKEGSGSEEQAQSGVTVDFYLVIFLKFIASIVPTIEVDSTTATSF